MQFLTDSGKVRGSVRTKIHLIVLNAEIGERTRNRLINSENINQGVIRPTGQAQHGVFRTQNPEQRNRQSMGSGRKLVTDQGILSPHAIGPDRLQRLAARIVVPVPGGSAQMHFTDPVADKGGKNLLLVIRGDFGNALKSGADFREGVIGRPAQLFVNGKKRIVHEANLSM